MDFEESVRRVIRAEGLIDPGDRVLVGVSGGMDSATLFSVLRNLKEKLSIELAIAHVNHQLRGTESQRDEAFVREIAETAGVPFHLLREDVKGRARASGRSVQHAGRDVRYAFFSRLIAERGYQKVAVAHNRDDQVETFLLRVIKGTGINGLSSIPIRRGTIIRPFLRTYRVEIEAHAARLGLSHVEDSSNLKDNYERNFIRRRISPLLEELNPRFRQKVLHLLEDITAVNAGFDKEARGFLQEHNREDDDDIRLPVGKLRALDGEVRFRVLSGTLSRMEPTFIALRQHINLIERSLVSQRPNNAVTLPHGIKVERVYNIVRFTRKPQISPISAMFNVQVGSNAIPELDLTIEILVENERPHGLPTDRQTVVLDADRLGPLAVRTFREGDRFVPLGMAGSVKLKDYFISRKIPRERRRMIPILTSGENIAWVVGERIDDRCKVTATTTRFMRITANPQKFVAGIEEA